LLPAPVGNAHQELPEARLLAKVSVESAIYAPRVAANGTRHIASNKGRL
jgi:hypothetical protein